MLIPEFVVNVVFAETFGIGAIALVAFFVLRGIRKRAWMRSILNDVPVSENDRRRRRAQILSGLLAAGLLATGVVECGVFMHGSHVALVSKTRSIYKQFVVGTTSIDVGERSVTIQGVGSGSTWIVNLADMPVVIRIIDYSQSTLGIYSQPDIVRFPPGSATLLAGRVDYFGAADVPPNAIEGHGGYERRRWLTW